MGDPASAGPEEAGDDAARQPRSRASDVPGALLEIEARFDASLTAMLVLAGEIDLSNAEKLTEAVDVLAGREPKRFVIDMRGVSFHVQHRRPRVA